MRIGNIENYYGGIHIKKEDNKYYWSIENFNGHNWKEIPKYLYDTLTYYQSNNCEVNNLTRVEVIDKDGRSYVNWKDDNNIELSYQDNNRTLKIFIKNE